MANILRVRELLNRKKVTPATKPPKISVENAIELFDAYIFDRPALTGKSAGFENGCGVRLVGGLPGDVATSDTQSIKSIVEHGWVWGNSGAAMNPFNLLRNIVPRNTKSQRERVSPTERQPSPFMASEQSTVMNRLDDWRFQFLLKRPCDGRVHRGDPTKQYRYQMMIGDDGGDNVFLATHKRTGVKVAIKTISFDDAHANEVLDEIWFTRTNNHRNLVSCFDSFCVDTDIWLVMEYMNGGSLGSITKMTQLSEKLIATILKEVIMALANLHSRSIMHRDLKSYNVFLTQDGRVKLGDFGLTVYWENGKRLKKRVGTPLWITPEVIVSNFYDLNADIWSLGILAMELIEGEPPLAHKRDVEDVYSTVLRMGKPELKPSSRVSHEMAHFLNCCLNVDSAKRWNVFQLLDHPLLKMAVSTDQLVPNIETGREIFARQGRMELLSQKVQNHIEYGIVKVREDIMFRTFGAHL